jgi:hypothetical protein
LREGGANGCGIYRAVLPMLAHNALASRRIIGSLAIKSGKTTEAEILDQARAAIARNPAKRPEILERLRKAGIDLSQLEPSRLRSAVTMS